jgi:hypothetical protein
MRNRFGSSTPKELTVYAIAAIVVLANGSARAGDDCLAAPNSDPPRGSHWYYRLDSVRQRHCWFLAAEGRKVRVEPEVRTETAGDRLAAFAQAEPPLPLPRPAIAPSPLAQANVEGIAQGASPGASAVEPRPDPEPAADDGDQKAAVASAPQIVDANEESTRPVAAGVANARVIMLIRAALLVASALGVTGIFAAFRIAVRRQRPVYVERGRPARDVSMARERLPPPFAALRQYDLKRPPVEQTDPQDVEAGIRQILEAMQRQAAGRERASVVGRRDQLIATEGVEL